MKNTTTYLLIGAAGVALYLYMTRKGKPKTLQQTMLEQQNAGF